MDPWKKKLKFWKLYFLRLLPYFVLAFLLFSAISIIKDGLSTTKSNFLVSNCANMAPGEVIPCKNLVKKPHNLYYNTVFKRLFHKGYISQTSKALTLDSTNGQDVLELKKIGVSDAMGITDMPSELFIVSGQGISHPFENNTFDFEFFGYNTRFKYWTAHPAHTAFEIGRTLKVGGYVAIHIVINDEYSYNSFVNLFTCCTLVSSQLISGLEYSLPSVHELIFKKEMYLMSSKCMVPEIRRKIINDIEPLVTFQQPYSWEGPWGNDKATLKYLSSMVDLSFKERYIYIDVGANSYNTSIGTWFDKEYPKQNKPFEIYAIEADKSFQKEYIGKKGITLLPYAAWVRNETLSFQIYKVTPNEGERFEELGFIPEKRASTKEEKATIARTFTVEGFDFVDWLQKTVTKRDFVVMKMDVEGAEVHLLKKLIESGTMCLLDELFLECHYDRWLKCCSGPKSNKYKFTFEQCLNTFRDLRNDHGCIVHQWW